MLRNFILRTIINAVAIAIIISVLPGIHVVNDKLTTLIVLGIILGIINAIVKPLLTFLTCPFIIFTFGLFILIINGLMLELTAAISGGRLTIDSFGWAILGGIVMTIVNIVAEKALNLKDK